MDYLKRKIRNWLTSSQIEKGITSENIFNNFFHGWKKKRIIWTLNVMLDVVKNHVRNIEYPTMDNYLYKLAEEQGKTIGDIENVTEVCNIFNNIDSKYLLFLIKTIVELKPRASSLIVVRRAGGWQEAKRQVVGERIGRTVGK